MKKLLLLSCAAAMLSACSFSEDVAIDSMPSGADVFVNNELMGQTPTSLELDCDNVYEIRLAKKGYKDQIVNLASVRTNPLVKFGPLVDTGYYNTLGSVDTKLSPDFIPATKGTNPFGDMASSILKADDMKKSGKISAEEHSYMLNQILEFYGK